MKVRTGFVSNSSSSSFIIATKPGTTPDDLVKIFKVPDDSPIRWIASELAEILLNKTPMTAKEAFAEMKDEYGYDDEWLERDEYEVIEKAIKRGLEIRMGSVSDEEGGMEAVLCDSDFDYEDENIIIKKEGGY